MTTEKSSPVAQFLAALKRQGPISVIINAARKVEVDEIAAAEECALAKGIEEFAGTKNGPMLLMGLPGPLQALLSFSDAVLPGLDRLGCLKATPRQVVNRLLGVKDDLLLAKYPFDKVGKSDWAHYFRSCKGEPVQPFLRFLKVPDSAGGFSDEEIGDGVLANRRMVDVVPLDRVGPDVAAELIVSGTAKPLWQKYDLARFGKEHWRKILMGADVESPPRECVRFLSNEDGCGFSNDELIELAHHCDAAAKWIDPNATPFKAAYALRVKGKGLDLWRRFPFAKLGKSEWRTLLDNPRIEIPPAFAETVKKGVFSVAELCELAKGTKAVVDYIPCDKLSQAEFLDLFLATRSKKLWNGYDFGRLTGPGWKRLICSLKTKGIVNTANHIKTATGLTTEIVSCLLKVNPGYCKYVPADLISADDAVEALFDCPGLWDEYDFRRFSDGQILVIVEKSSERESWPKAVSHRFTASKGSFSDDEILSLSEKNVVNVLDLLTVKRIHQSGLAFFERLCVLAEDSRAVANLAKRKLIAGQKPWLELDMDFLVALLASIPSCRTCVAWQRFELRHLDKLQTADKAFRDELCRERALALFAWRYWKIFLTVAIVIAMISVECLHHRRSDLRNVQVDKGRASSPATPSRAATSMPYGGAARHSQGSARTTKNGGAGNAAKTPQNSPKRPSGSGGATRMRPPVVSPNSPANGNQEACRRPGSDAEAARQLKEREGREKADSILAHAKGLLDSSADAKATASEVKKTEESIRELEAWQRKFGAFVQWRVNEVERCRKRMIAHLAGVKERMALVSAINNAREYGTLYESVRTLSDRHPHTFECRRIDASRIPDAAQVRLATAKSGLIFVDGPYEFAGVVKVCPKNAQDVVPLLMKGVAPDADVYCVSPRRYDYASGEWQPPSMKKVFERTPNGGFRKVGGVDYDKCQGVGLFVRKGGL